MIPSIDQTFEAVVQAVSDANRDTTFGERLLKSDQDRETWLYHKVAAEMRNQRFDARPDHRFIDIGVFSPTLAQIIEVKFYYCHQFSRRRHKYLCNTWTDFFKRSIYGLPQQAILFVGQYTSMPVKNEAGDLYRVEEIREALEEGGYDFDRFEAELIREFGNICYIRPSNHLRRATPQIWLAKCNWAEMLLRAWVLELKALITERELIEGLRACTTDHEFRKRMANCQKAWERVKRHAAEGV